MGFLGALQELVSVILACNAATGHKDASMTEEYANTLEYIMSMPSYLISRDGNEPPKNRRY